MKLCLTKTLTRSTFLPGILVLAGMLCCGCQAGNDSIVASSNDSVSTSATSAKTSHVSFRQGDAVWEFTGRGILLPAMEVTLRATSSGRVIAADVQWGDNVEAGELLLQVEPTWAEFDQEKADAYAEQARLGYNRTVSAWNQVNEGEQKARDGLRQAQSAYSQLQGRLFFKRLKAKAASGMSQARDGIREAQKARMQVRHLNEDAWEAMYAAREADALAEMQFDACELHAPVSGTLADWTVQAGDVVTAGQVVGELIQAEPFRIAVWLPPQRLAELRSAASSDEDQAWLEKLSAEVLPEGTSRWISAKAVKVYPKPDPRSGHLLLELELPKVEQPLLPGMRTDVRLKLG